MRAATGPSIHLPPDERRNLHVTQILRRLSVGVPGCGARRSAGGAARGGTTGWRWRWAGNGSTGVVGIPRAGCCVRRRAAVTRAVETGRDHRDADLALHRRLVHGAEDDLGVVARGVVDDLVDLVHFAQREVVRRR